MSKEIKQREILTKKNGSSPTNILIEGDNYHALSVLNYTHKGVIDMIYIDPPYNTGNRDFIYNDKFVDLEDTYRHSKWLSFMSKRLQLAKNLLKNDGVIFISIDDNEQSNLKLLCDEIFGEENFISLLSVENNPKGRKNSNYISVSSEYCLIYAKNKYIGYFTEVIPKDVKDMIKDKEGNYIHNSGKRVLVGENGFNKRVTNYKSSKHYSVYYNKSLDDLIIKKENKLSEIDNELISRGYGRYISYTKGNFVENTYTSDKLLSLFNEGELDIKEEKIYEKNFSSSTRLKSLLTNRKYKAIVNNQLIEYEIDLKTTSAQQMLNEMLGKEVFSFPKNTSFIKLLAQLCPNKNAIVLDYFAGSGTTGHAVLMLNSEDGGSRKFILCTNNEGNNNDGCKIAEDICYPRIKKAIQGYKKQSGEEVAGLGGGLKYYKTDFVDAEQTDVNKRNLVDKSTDMLCLKEDCFDEVKKGQEYIIFSNGQGKLLGIIYDDAGIVHFKKAAKKMNKKFVVYVFSLDESAREDEFDDMRSLVDLKPIPAVILNVYKRIFK